MHFPFQKQKCSRQSRSESKIEQSSKGEGVGRAVGDDVGTKIKECVGQEIEKRLACEDLVLR